MERFPVFIAAVLFNLFSEIRSNAENIIHQMIYIFENIGIDFLNHVFPFPAVIIIFGKISGIDMTGTEQFAIFQFPFKIKLR